MDDLTKLYGLLNADEKKVVDFAIFIIFRKHKEDTVSDEAMGVYVAYITHFVALMQFAQDTFDKVAQPQGETK